MDICSESFVFQSGLFAEQPNNLHINDKKKIPLISVIFPMESRLYNFQLT